MLHLRIGNARGYFLAVMDLLQLCWILGLESLRIIFLLERIFNYSGSWDWGSAQDHLFAIDEFNLRFIHGTLDFLLNALRPKK